MADQTRCPECTNVGFVRPDRIIKNPTTVALYCDSCDHRWTIPERRKKRRPVRRRK